MNEVSMENKESRRPHWRLAVGTSLGLHALVIACVALVPAPRAVVVHAGAATGPLPI